MTPPPAVAAPLVRLEGVTRSYPAAEALRGVDMAVEKGDWVCVMGPSGSGKTTLLNLIGGLDRPSRGTVTVDSARLDELSEEALAEFRREKIGFVFQQAHLVTYLDAVENVMLAQYFHSMADEAEAVEALRRVGLGDRLRHRPSQMSGGELQRVCLARALVNDPAILLADEPTGNLDRANTEAALDLLEEIHARDGFTVILVTHDPFVAKRGRRILSMEDGRIVRDERVRP